MQFDISAAAAAAPATAAEGAAAADAAQIEHYMTPRQPQPPPQLNYLKKPIHPKIMYKLLKLICNDQFHIGSKWYYVINYEAYRLMLYKGYNKFFLYNIKTYYKKTGEFLFEREFIYTQFVLFLRHICASNNIEFLSTGSLYYPGSGNRYTTYRIEHETRTPINLKCF